MIVGFVELGSGIVSVSGLQSSESPEEEGETDGSWMSDGSDFGWETGTEDEEQDVGLLTPAEKLCSKPSISPEGVAATKQAAGT